MKKTLSLVLMMIFCATQAPVMAQQGSTGEPNTPEETARLDYIVGKLEEYVRVLHPAVTADMRHFNELHRTNANPTNFVEEFKKIYPQTSAYYEKQRALRLSRGTPKGRPRGKPISGGRLFGWFTVVDWLSGFYSMHNAEMEQNVYNDLVAGGMPEDIARMEANFQSDRESQWHLLLVPLASHWSLAQELWTEMNDGSRYSLEEYMRRYNAGEGTEVYAGRERPRDRNGALAFESDGGFFGFHNCVIIGEAASPDQAAGTDLPSFDGEITVTATALPGCP